MKRLEDLKKDLLDGKVENFYVFYGEDYGIRHHYVEKINSFYPGPITCLDTYESVKNTNRSMLLFGPTKRIVLIYNDIDFLKLNEYDISKFIQGLVNTICIFIYEKIDENSDLFTKFDNYITYFPVVQPSIATEFVNSEIKLIKDDASILAYRCDDNYSNILLESDKIKEYASAHNISQQSAYEVLNMSNQLIEKCDDFNPNFFIEDLLTQNARNYGYWYDIINKKPDQFYMSLTFMFYDLLIAVILKLHGYSKGSSRAYNLKLPWGRVKVIRDLDIPYTSDDLAYMAHRLVSMDTSIKSGDLDKTKIADYVFNELL